MQGFLFPIWKCPLIRECFEKKSLFSCMKFSSVNHRCPLFGVSMHQRLDYGMVLSIFEEYYQKRLKQFCTDCNSVQ